MGPITSDDELVDLVSIWYGQGLVTDTNLARLKDRYLLDLGATTCTSCPNWKQDMLTHFRLYLRSAGRTLMATTTNKYQIKADIGSFYSALHGTLFTNASVASTGVTPITDAIVEDLKKLDEGYADYFEANPDYVAPDPKEAKAKADAEAKAEKDRVAAEKKAKDDQAKAEKEAAEKEAAEKAKQEADAAEAKANAEADAAQQNQNP